MILELLAGMIEAGTDDFSAIIGEIVLMIYCGVMFWSVGSLLTYQMFLVSTN
jgi:hypothetical protein